MQHALEISSANIQQYNKYLEQSEVDPKLLIMLRSGFRKLLDKYTVILLDLKRENETLKTGLSQKARKLEAQKRKYNDDVERHMKEIETHQAKYNKAFSKQQAQWDDELQDQATYESLYNEQCVLYEKLAQKHDEFRARVSRLYDPQLVRKHGDLRREFTDAEDRIRILQAERNEWKQKAEESEADLKRTRKENRKIMRGAEEAEQRTNAQMFDNVQTYYDTLRENGKNGWDVHMVHAEVRNRDKRIEDMQKSMEALQGKLDHAHAKYAELEAHGIREESWQRSDDGPAVPSYETAEEVRGRGLMMRELEKQMWKDKAAKEDYNKLIEKARKWKMGKWYPRLDEAEYERVRKQKQWDRWEVDKFLEVAEEVDREAANKLKVLDDVLSPRDARAE
ncbi:hypothetical protein EJ04DRAFT_511710 [Polyplosphaeria fusca]|uniref:Uncharacterized protein n=1 Tax=Polyplosphaeria fusca TaxID=682080 RepID=A0A9P4V4K9_9PLEO|nr:hypothetical protein EJ04DRAFT_511710 [Polyplosphaeria fusca]